MCSRILIKDIHVCSVLIVISQVFLAITNNVALCVIMHMSKTFPGLYSEEWKHWTCASPISIVIAQMLTLGDESILSGLQPSRRVLISLHPLFSFTHSRPTLWDPKESPRLQRLQHARLPCPLLSPRVCSNSCPLSQWCHPTISSSVIPFSSCL